MPTNYQNREDLGVLNQQFISYLKDIDYSGLKETKIGAPQGLLLASILCNISIADAHYRSIMVPIIEQRTVPKL